MTDHKFADDDVIKALECCRDFGDCSLCPYEEAHFEDEPYCAEKMHTDALALISRQKREIERLEKHTELYHELRAEAIKEFAERLKENETKSCSWCVHSKHGTRSEKCDNFFPTHQRAYCLNYDRWKSKIDTLVKEMTEENK